jgi:hypothetical protein
MVFSLACHAFLLATIKVLQSRHHAMCVLQLVSGHICMVNGLTKTTLESSGINSNLLAEVESVKLNLVCHITVEFGGNTYYISCKENLFIELS